MPAVRHKARRAAKVSEEQYTQSDLERGRLLFAGRVDFVMGAVSLKTLPGADRPEVAFAGRSNVGKSSLVNALTGRKTLARTSNTPGRTQELNYFEMGMEMDTPAYLVDLPGYGYAKIERKKVNAWTRLVKDYLRGRPNLRRVLLLIDSRHGLKENDREIMHMLDEAAVNYQIVLTKLDKLKVADREKIVKKTQEDAKKFIACHPIIMATSSEKGWGLQELRAEIGQLTAF
ncbi:ribosome biogenesis GTP-binding protein YihA/YsxC [Kordiimonas lipolytica]|uniref:Probable GTP-binding protein EngB n=1 Tax=Kordiimonas lipolytica TaxID=1662421 RepID=A0ABV8UDX0_9PROT